MALAQIGKKTSVKIHGSGSTIGITRNGTTHPTINGHGPLIRVCTNRQQSQKHLFICQPAGGFCRPGIRPTPLWELTALSRPLNLLPSLQTPPLFSALRPWLPDHFFFWALPVSFF